MIGQRIGDYTIEQRIPGGGIGDVYLAWDNRNQWRVALKVLKPEATHDAKAVKRFRREIETARQLRHPNLVSVYATGIAANSQDYMAMEYLAGGNLHDELQRYAKQGRAMPVERALYVVRRVAGLLDYIHGQGVIHRDLKPANILIRNDGEPVITDLGIAAVAGAASLTGTLEALGTPQYMAPEQIRGTKNVDARCDIYALGVVLYELLSNRYPHHADNHWALLHKKMIDRPTPIGRYRTDLSPQIVAIIDRCLQDDPGKRFQSAAELAQALDKAVPLRPAPIPVSGASDKTPSPSPARSHPIPRPNRSTLWTLAGIGGLAILLFFIFQIADTDFTGGGRITRIVPVTATPLSPTSTAAVTVFDPVDRTLTISANGGANVRVEPSWDAGIIQGFLKGDVLEIGEYITSDGQWVQVITLDGQTGWILRTDNGTALFESDFPLESLTVFVPEAEATATIQTQVTPSSNGTSTESITETVEQNVENPGETDTPNSVAPIDAPTLRPPATETPKPPPSVRAIELKSPGLKFREGEQIKFEWVWNAIEEDARFVILIDDRGVTDVRGNNNHISADGWEYRWDGSLAQGEHTWQIELKEGGVVTARSAQGTITISPSAEPSPDPGDGATDSDGDGVPDDQDNCPSQGPNDDGKGCPNAPDPERARD
ncbi:MAG: protein kinase [Anaerolineae bacterium]|nr:protein kinase [Anaerolineae bacterium]MCO5205591.1 protein kinase [Anaerolineae bacterium]